MAIALGLTAAACASRANDDVASNQSSSPSTTTTVTRPLANAFATSAANVHVPRDLLVAIAKVEGGLGIPAERAEIDVDNEVPAAGPLQLRRGKLDTLRRGAELAGVTEIDLRKHSDLALDAGALVLREVGARTNAREDDLASWSAAIAEMSGYADEAHRDRYVHQVFATLARGGSFDGRDGEGTISLAPHPEIPPSLTIDIDVRLHTLATSQYPGAEWIPTSCNNKCTPTRAGNSVQFIVIHDTEGNWNASVATLQNDPEKSVQYIIDVDGKVAQFVTEETTAWHAGNFSYNQRSIGIEHVGYATKPFPEAEYVASGKLVDHLTTKYNVPRDRAHIIGHDQIPNGTKIAQTAAACATSPKACQSNLSFGGASHHTDPGIWEWATFMPRFNGNAKCNDVTNLWNCSNDKTKAFRCANEKVEVITCASACEVKPNGVDDACTPVTPQSAPPTGEEPPVGAGPVGVPGEDEGAARKTAGFLPSSDERQPQTDDGCSVVATGSSKSSTSTTLLVLLGVAMAAARRRRSN